MGVGLLSQPPQAFHSDVPIPCVRARVFSNSALSFVRQTCLGSARKHLYQLYLQPAASLFVLPERRASLPVTTEALGLAMSCLLPAFFRSALCRASVPSRCFAGIAPPTLLECLHRCCSSSTGAFSRSTLLCLLFTLCLHLVPRTLCAPLTSQENGVLARLAACGAISNPHFSAGPWGAEKEGRAGGSVSNCSAVLRTLTKADGESFRQVTCQRSPVSQKQASLGVLAMPSLWLGDESSA